MPTGCPIRGPHGAKLALAGRGEQIAFDVVSQTDPRNDAVDAIAVSEGVAQSFQDEDARPFADDQPIGGGIERRAFSAEGKRPQLRETHLRIEAIGPRQTAGQHGVGSAGEQFVGR